MDIPQMIRIYELQIGKISCFILPLNSHCFHFSLLVFYYQPNRRDLNTNRATSFQRKWFNKCAQCGSKWIFYETVNSWVINTVRIPFQKEPLISLAITDIETNVYLINNHVKGFSIIPSFRLQLLGVYKIIDLLSQSYHQMLCW